MSCVVYTCHNVVPLPEGKEERGTVDLKTFLHQLHWLKRLGIRFIPMSDLRGWLEGQKNIPKRSAVLTFDDALISISEHVFPFLKQQAVPITIFVVAGLIGRESNFSTHPAAPARRHLDFEQLKSLLNTGLVEIGAHGYHHVNLTQIDDDKLRQELHDAKNLLEESLAVEVPYLAYPWGNSTETATQLAKKAGYKLAFTTQKKKLVSTNIDPFRLPRVSWGRRATLFKLYKYYLIPRMRSAG
jgi:peptidoglycan/xylan/chitin deacetylase (PgdA/CDA1 family)